MTITTAMTTTNSHEHLISIRDAAEVLTVCEATVRRMIRRGAIPAIRVGTVYRVRLGDALAALTVNAAQ